MNIDLHELKALATAAKSDPYDAVAGHDYGMAMAPAVTLKLVEEIERHRQKTNTEGCKPEISIHDSVSLHACMPVHGLDKAEGEQPDLNSPIHSDDMAAITQQHREFMKLTDHGWMDDASSLQDQAYALGRGRGRNEQAAPTPALPAGLQDVLPVIAVENTKQMVSNMEIALADFLRGKMQRLRASYTLAFEAGWNARGAAPIYDLTTDVPVLRILDKAEGCKPDLTFRLLQIAERSCSLMEDWVQLAGVRDENLTDQIKETRALLETQRPTWSAGIQELLVERRRQVRVEGLDPERDQQYEEGELADAAATYAYWAYHLGQRKGTLDQTPRTWTLPPEQWKPASQRQMLIKAGALILAELDRLDRQQDHDSLERKP